MTDSYNCKTCNFSSDTKANYNQHIKTKKHLSHLKVDKKTVGKPDTNIVNKTSDKPLKKTNDKSTSKAVNKPSKVKTTFECDYCDEEFTSKNRLSKHVKLCEVDSVSEESVEESSGSPNRASYDVSFDITADVDMTNKSFIDTLNATKDEVIKKLLLDNHRLNQDRNTLISENKYILGLIENINAEYRKRFLEMNDTFNNIVKSRDIYSMGEGSDDGETDDSGDNVEYNIEA
jgi:hypothetical protein